MELTKNGGAPQQTMVTTSWLRDDFANGRRRYKGYVIDRSNGAVIAEAVLEVPNLEVAKVIYASLGQMLAQQPPEILRV